MFGKCRKIRCIVRLRQILRRWRDRARLSSANRVPSDVPPGHVALTVGSSSTRYVVRATHLNHPLFRKLLNGAEEEYGFSSHGLLAIPCDEATFEEVLRLISRPGSGKPSRFGNRECWRVGLRSNVGAWQECRPLLEGFTASSSQWLVSVNRDEKASFVWIFSECLTKGWRVVLGSIRTGHRWREFL